MFAQALLEKGLLDGAIAGVSSAFATAVDAIETRPYLLIVLAVVLILLLRKRR